MGKLNYLNVGCGSKFHKDWVNVDMDSSSEEVISTNLIKGIPFPDNTFDVVYHSQVLEHIPKEQAPAFIKECFRVLKPGGIIRVVVPDLENIVDEYKKFLNKNIENPDEQSEANYDWIMLEMYDQTVRNHSGGQMREFLRQPQVINEKYVIDRTGFITRNIRSNYVNGNTGMSKYKKAFSSLFFFKKAVRLALQKVKHTVSSGKSNIGTFRVGGEVHMWMYDRYSLSRLLKSCGFTEVVVKSPFESSIPNWADYELDVKDNMVYDPTSLFVEAKKPL